MRRLICIILAICSAPATAGLTRHDVLVIANSNSAASQAVANYYKIKRNIPASHVKLISCSTGDSVIPADFNSIREQIKAHLLSLGSVPGDPANDPIKTIVLTTDIPHFITDYPERYSAVDSALAALFSESEWGKEPLGVNGLSQPAPGSINPYSGDYTSFVNFESYRASGDESAYYESFPEAGFILTRMLDANTALAAGENGALFRGIKSGGQWSWSAIKGVDKNWIGWRISGLCVLDSTHAYACTGNPVKPHGGGTIIATSNSGQTWTRIRWGGGGQNALFGIDFVDTSHGWAIGSSQVSGSATTPFIIRTTNGGSSWQDITANLPASFFPRAISAADVNNVWICGSGGQIYHSADAGNTWSPANTGAPSVGYYAIWVKSSGGAFKGWAAGASGTIVRTEDGLNWTLEAAGLTTSTITDLTALDQDNACASFGGTSVLVYNRSLGWKLENTNQAPIISSAIASDGSMVAVGGTRYIFAKTGGLWSTSYTAQDTAWRLRYLVMRLDGYKDDVNPADGIPDAIKAIIDRACAAVSPGKFVLDEATNIGVGGFKYARDTLVSIVGESNVIYDTTNTYLTHQNNVIGYTSWGAHDQGAKLVTAWGRPFHNWVPGGIAAMYQSSDGRGFDVPYYIDSFAAGGAVVPNKLTFTWSPTTSPYDHYRAVLHASDGSILASAEFISGTAQIDLSAIPVWPEDHKTYVQMYYPIDDPFHPGGVIYFSRYPAAGASTDIYDNRAAGYSLSMFASISLMSELLLEGATGAIANVAEPWSNYCGQPSYLFPAYALGFTWGEAAYIGLAGIGWQEVALGDPLMAPYSTPPQVSLTSPTMDGQVVSGSVTVEASAAATGASSIQRVQFWLDDTLLGTDSSAPYKVTLDTTSLPDGVHSIEATAYENDYVQNTGSATRVVMVSNSHTLYPAINNVRALADGSKITLERKTVSAAYNGFFYVTEPSRVQGIRVVSTASVIEGQQATIIGTLHTTNGEREVLAESVY